MEHKKVLMDWGYMAYREGGRGRPLVFVHGAGNNAGVWQGVVETLEGGFRAMALDLPGHGGSSCALVETVEDYASRVTDFLDALDLEDVVLVGHSMGGAIAIKVLAASSRVTAGILVGTGAVLEVNPKLLKGLREDFVNTVATMARWCFSKGAPPGLMEEAREMMLQAGREVLYRDMRACSLYSGREDLGAITVPTLVICGDKDVMTPVALSRELVEGIGNARLTVVPDSGHMVQLEAPGAVARAIEDFLQ